MNLSQLNQIPLNSLSQAGMALLLGSFGLRVILALRKGESVEACFVALAIGLLGITFFSSFIKLICQLSDSLSHDIERLGDTQSLKKLVWESIQASAGEADSNGRKVGFNIPSLVEQLFRTGVWGIATTIADFFFLIAQSFVEVRRDILLSLVQFLMPLIWGVYPIRPEIGHTILAYVIEIGLWGPCLYLIQIIIAHVAPQYLYRPGSLGIPIVALEIVATILTLEVPKVVHQLLGGVLHPNGESTAIGLILLGSRSVKKGGSAKKSETKKGRN